MVESWKSHQSSQRDFAEAGADVLTTASYQATVRGFLDAGLAQTASEAEGMLCKAVQLAREALESE